MMSRRFFISDTFWARVPVTPSSWMDTSASRVRTTLNPDRVSISLRFLTTARFIFFSSSPFMPTAPLSIPPWPASSTTVYLFSVCELDALTLTWEWSAVAAITVKHPSSTSIAVTLVFIRLNTKRSILSSLPVVFVHNMKQALHK